MRILLDPQIFIEQRFGGISRLFAELWKQLSAMPGVTVDCPLLYSSNLHLEEIGLQGKIHTQFFHNKQFFGSRRIEYQLKKLSYKKALKQIAKNDFDVFVPTYYNPYFLPVLKKPFLLTVYDMIHEILPEYFGFDKITVPNKSLLIDKADAIAAISHHTKSDLLSIHPHYPEENVSVIHLAQSINDADAGPISFALPARYVLFVGNRSNYKNFNFLLTSIAHYLKANPGLSLFCAGGGKFTTEELQLIESLGVTGSVLQHSYRDNEIGAIYRKASVFVFPSLYEGFGIPVLEAMKCECPVVLSNASCFPEVAGDAGLYFDPGNQSQLVNSIASILDSDALRQSFIQKGLERERQFSWKHTSEGYYQSLRKLVAE